VTTTTATNHYNLFNRLVLRISKGSTRSILQKLSRIRESGRTRHILYRSVNVKYASSSSLSRCYGKSNARIPQESSKQQIGDVVSSYFDINFSAQQQPISIGDSPVVLQVFQQNWRNPHRSWEPRSRRILGELAIMPQKFWQVEGLQRISHGIVSIRLQIRFSLLSETISSWFGTR